MIIIPKTLKGFHDSLPDEEVRRRYFVDRLSRVFDSFGFSPIDTPVLEYADILLGKGGGDTDKQVYRFSDHGGRNVALRFDLTVPFARFMAMHRGKLVLPFKRYHIAKAWRGENTQKGRFREFMQCDFDIVGTEAVSADFEILTLMVRSMRALGIGEYRIHFSHRETLSSFLSLLNLNDVSQDVLRTVDKLQKLGEQKIKELLQPIAGEERTGRILSFIQPGGNYADTLKNLDEQTEGKSHGVRRLEQLSDMIHEVGLESCFVLDPSIIRGLDYYTGLVYETFSPSLPELGSICSGGRYDDLAGLYSKETLPGVGASIGLDRILAAGKDLGLSEKLKAPLQVLILCMNDGYIGYYHKLAGELRDKGISVDIYPLHTKLAKQFQYAEKKGIPFALICGEDERNRNSITLKDLRQRKSYTDLDLDSFADLLMTLRNEAGSSG